MSSTYTVFPSQFLDGGRPDRLQDQRAIAPAHPIDYHHGGRPSTPTDQNTNANAGTHLSPYSSHFHSTSASPTFHNTNPSAESTPASVNYQSSDFSSEVEEDPFYGVDFSAIDSGAPAFLDGPHGFASSLANGFGGLGDQSALDIAPAPELQQQYSHVNGPGYLISPEQTPSLRTVSPQSEKQGPSNAFVSNVYESEDQLHQLPKTSQTVFPGPQYTPDTSSIPSSDDGVAPSIPAMSAQSPRVTVSLWGKDGDVPLQNIGSAFHLDSAATNLAIRSTDAGAGGDAFIAPPQRAASESGMQVSSHEDAAPWAPDSSALPGQRMGIDPTSRPQGETSSANDLAARRATQERNQEVDQWLTTSAHASARSSVDVESQPRPQVQSEGVPDREIALGHETTNKMQPGRTYYVESASGPLAPEDIDLMRQNRVWDDAPAVLPIADETAKHYQPQTSNAAIQKFETMCRDNDSVVSRAATWGTRRRSLPSILDIEGITSGNFLKKLSISRGEPRKPNVFLKELRTLVRKPSATGLANLKRSFSSQEDDLKPDPGAGDRRESRDSLAPPSRAMSWGKRPTPSINTALVSMGSGIAAIGTTHARSGSISTTTPVASPKSPLLKVLNRARSKSDLPKLGTENSFSNIADMWKKSGGPPVATLAKPPMVSAVSLGDQDDDDDDEDDLEDADMKLESTKLIEDITPNFAGFQQHILKLNPMLADRNGYLVDRIAHQQIIRYKSLLNSRVKHLGHIRDRDCHCGSMCIALGGSAVLLDSRGDSRGLDPLSARLEGSDGDVTPLEGAIAPESFPQDIPMPPTQTLPAEFECQLCFQAKKFQKPSDWTKHVHEDVQPFTCTWDRCRDPKIFKRKADWVRHENEGHRHLEWWTCDVEDCRHTCYRRDNFLQHLVREHKFTEPKVKTKAAIKRAGALDPTWQKVERCHAETHARPQDEPCRFCGKVFPTWKKLTVHLAKHMEQISLPILRLVARRDLEPDTIISPVQEPPQRPFAPLPPPPQQHQQLHPQGLHQQQMKPEPHQQYGHSPSGMRHPSPGGHMQQYQPHQSPFVYPIPGPGAAAAVSAAGSYPAFPQALPHAHAQAHFDNPLVMQNLDTTVMDWPHVSPVGQVSAAGMAQQPGYALGLPVTTAATGFVAGPQQHYLPTPSSANPGLEPFPQMPMGAAMNPLRLQDPSSGGQLQYDGMMDPSSAISAGTGAPGQGQYVPQGSVSPFNRSPHQQAGNFY